nr:hypothetical protein [uncultured Draconibacterium sp.]
MDTWIVILFIIIIIIEGWNAIALKRLKKLAENGSNGLTDDRYFDLKYKFQLYAAIGTLAFFLIAFFGWNTKDGIRENYIQEIEPLRDSIGKAKQDIESIAIDIENIDKNIQRNPRFHVVMNKEVTTHSITDRDTIFFEDCKVDVLGNKIERFRLPPVITFFDVNTNNPKMSSFSDPFALPAIIFETTTDYVVYRLMGGGALEPVDSKYYISFLIMDISDAAE